MLSTLRAAGERDRHRERAARRRRVVACSVVVEVVSVFVARDGRRVARRRRAGDRHRVADRGLVGRRGDGQRRLALRVVGRSGRRCSRAGRAPCRPPRRASAARTGRPTTSAPRPSRRACRCAKPIEAIVGSVPNGDAAQVGQLPRLLGDQADARAHVAHRLQALDRGAGRCRCRARTGRARRRAPATGGPLPLLRRRPRMAVGRAVAVAVAVVAQEAVAAGGRRA